ncbi:hypothetical protein CFC21_068818 [Triticum aestivum]|uniref:Uncharacterized protein n=3 Tax=Triticum TaxID=4564 RepID=A0A9R0RWU4_TRITD|nr:uncharacterized protein LOC123063048 isoform X1 [Triticum aestivum]XP_044342702.1 uncharacterized protein LOC123063048 isoform X1 [Triticum aestivum]XP_044342704.1 uncharacterized protein LOC123063048 isoform X1 [Triticum aestivum]XP_044342705.1 uncharacterized protein LOC123063048 isoform X1 [Triticum aestivum]XP_044342706.1 uncharacterized protein LOC123063048 isoform X1 [Triticum aestivum]XP_044342707.1 uncharacterized protein LOC123063048 isoform X1 [Triticum aestivum]XP_044342708.1 un
MADQDNPPCEGFEYISDLGERSYGSISGKIMNLSNGHHLVGQYVQEVMIKKGVHLKMKHFDILKQFQHSCAIPLLNFYPESMNMGRLIIPKVDDAFDNCFLGIETEVLFDSDGGMNRFFRNSVIELCDMINKLHGMNFILKDGITVPNLYVQKLSDGQIKIMFLLSEVKESKQTSAEGRSDWNSLKVLVERCFSEKHVQMKSVTRSWINFIGQQSFTIDKMRGYPDNWNWVRKGEYLMTLKSRDHRALQNSLRGTGITWPDEPLPYELQIIVDSSASEGRHYSKEVPLHYLVMLANAYKHFYSMGLHDIFGDLEIFVKYIEVWTTTIWTELFEIIGWPVSLHGIKYVREILW